MHLPKNQRHVPVISLLLTLLCALIFTGARSTQAQEMVAPPEVPGDTYYAAFPITMTVDGDLAEWAAVPYATFTDGPQPSPNPAQDGSIAFAAVADAQNLYFAAQVTDASIIAGQNGIQYWQEDSVEIYINATGNLDLTGYAPGVAQITIPAANIGGSPDATLLAGVNYETIPLRAVVVRTPTGYAVEASIPLVTNQWNITPAQDSAIGFQVQLNGASAAGARNLKLSWSNRDKTSDLSYQNPSLFGRLVFTQSGVAPSPAQPQQPAEPTQSLPTLIDPTMVAPTQAPAEQPAAAGFTVNGSTIIAPNGQPFISKGVNVSGLNWVWQRRTTDDVGLIVDCWRFNLVRVNNFLFRGEQPWAQNEVNNDLDAIVQTFTSRGVVVVFEAHDRIGTYYSGDQLNTLVSWFTDLASRYKNNPYVWFDVSNEPGGRGWVDRDNWLNMHRQVIRGIRDVAGANNIILVEGANGGQDAGDNGTGFIADENSAILSLANEVINFDGKSYPNIAFSIHAFDQWNGGDARLADFLDRVRTRNLALIIGEYGVQTDQNVQQAAQSVFNTAPQRGIGLAVWHWDGSDDNDLTTGTSTGGGWEINDCDNPTNLSWLGQQVWAHNRS